MEPGTQNLLAGFQLEKAKAGDMYTGVYCGFSDLDNGLLSLLTSFIGIKISQIKENLQSKEKDKRFFEALQTITSLMEDRTCVQLLMELKETLPQLTGYEHAGVYLHEPLSTPVLTVANELCTCIKSNTKAGGKDLARYADDIGITGRVFKEAEYVMSVKGKKEANFHEIDNMASYVEMSNFLFIPTYGFKSQKNGVIQLFNRKIGNPGESDLQSVKPYQKLVGMLIEGVMEANRIMNIDMNLRKVLNQLRERTGVYNREEFSYTLAITNLEVVVDNLQRIIKEHEETKGSMVSRSPPRISLTN